MSTNKEIYEKLGLILMYQCGWHYEVKVHSSKVLSYWGNVHNISRISAKSYDFTWQWLNSVEGRLSALKMAL